MELWYNLGNQFVRGPEEDVQCFLEALMQSACNGEGAVDIEDLIDLASQIKNEDNDGKYEECDLHHNSVDMGGQRR